MKKSALLIFASLMFVTTLAESRERIIDFQRGRAIQRPRGNERSQRVTQLSVGEATYNGNGCPQGTMRIVFSPDYLSFSMLFDKFIAETGSGPRPKFDNIICNTLIPIQIPEGMQMEITRVDYRGFSALPDKSNGFLNSIVNFRGPGGDGDRLTLRYNFKGPVMENYEISTDNAATDDTELSPCGGKTLLRVSNQLWIVSRIKGETASLTLDSVDSSSNAIYYVNWRACKKGPPKPPLIKFTR